MKLLSMLGSAQIKTVKLPDKKPGISDRSSLLRRRSVKIQFVWQKLCYSIPLAGLLQKHIGLRVHPQNAKNPSCVCARYALWTPYGSIMKVHVL